MPEDVVVYIVDGREFKSWTRGTLDAMKRYCRRPLYPARFSDHFIGVDAWGDDRGTIVCATPSLSNWIGKSLREFRSVAH